MQRGVVLDKRLGQLQRIDRPEALRSWPVHAGPPDLRTAVKDGVLPLRGYSAERVDGTKQCAAEAALVWVSQPRNPPDMVPPQIERSVVQPETIRFPRGFSTISGVLDGTFSQREGNI